MKGIDVSKHQGKIDWQKVKAAGVEFAIVRAGYGMYENQVDPQFAANMEGAISAGIPVGVYWYSYAETPGQAKKRGGNLPENHRAISGKAVPAGVLRPGV